MDIYHTELARILADKCKFTYGDAREVLDCLTEILDTELVKGNSIHFLGLGTLHIVTPKRKSYLHKRGRKLVEGFAPIFPQPVFTPAPAFTKRLRNRVILENYAKEQAENAQTE